MSDPSTDIRRALRQSIAWCFCILLWEFVSLPPTSHSYTWQGAWISFSLIPVSAFFLSRFAPASWIFVYGCGTSLLFLPRFFSMGRFILWARDVASDDLLIILSCIAVPVAFGFTCFTAASLRSALSAPEPPDEKTPAWTASSLGIAWAGCLLVSLVCVTFLSQQRPFLEYHIQWPTVLFTVLRSIGESVALASLLLFLYGGVNVRRSFVTPGGFLLLSLATLALYRLVATIALVINTSPETIWAGDDSSALGTAGILCASLILTLHIALKHKWRIPLILIVISLVSSYFVIGSSNRAVNSLYYGTAVLAVAGLVIALWRDRQQLNRSDWVGVATYVWLAIVSFVPLLGFRS